MNDIKKAVFPVAGLGTRFLPATKASPKEMLCIVDKPLIQYAVEEAIEAGITEMIFVTGRSKRSIEDHFDKSFELEHELEQKNKTALLELVRNIKPANVNCVYVRQPEALGLGHAVNCAAKLVGNDPFAVILADDLLDHQPGVLKQMVEMFKHYRSSIVAVEKILPEQSKSYGVVKGTSAGDRLTKNDLQELFINQLEDIIIILNKFNIITYSNKAAVENFGSNIEGKHIGSEIRIPELLDAIDNNKIDKELKKIDIELCVEDSKKVEANTCLLTAKGSTIELLTAERTALNFLGHLSGIATTTNKWVNEISGTNAKVRDTRKTTPGLRLLEKYAVKAGGGTKAVP